MISMVVTATVSSFVYLKLRQFGIQVQKSWKNSKISSNPPEDACTPSPLVRRTPQSSRHKRMSDTSSQQGESASSANPSPINPNAALLLNILPKEQFTPLPQKQLQFTDGCIFRAGMAGIGGAVMGGAMGVFMFSSSQDTSFTPSSTQDSYKWHSREGLKQLGKELRHTTLHWSKTFAVCGLAISSCECLIEQQLGIKNVFTNMAAGCVAGAGLGYQGGIHGMALGCAGFAAFGVAIDYFMDH